MQEPETFQSGCVSRQPLHTLTETAKITVRHRQLLRTLSSVYSKSTMGCCWDVVSQVFAWLLIFTWLGLFLLLSRVFNFDAHPLLALLALCGCPVLALLLWFLAAGLLFAFCWTIYGVICMLICVPSYIGYHYRRFWEQWTISPPRLGWRSLPGFADSQTPLLSEAGSSDDGQTTSKLCKECFHGIKQSSHISGSLSIFTRRTEWFQWEVPVRGSEFKASRRSCQLCNILWYSLGKQRRISLAGPLTPRRHLPDASPWLWLRIWQAQNGQYHISLFDDHASHPKNNLCKAIEIREGSSNPL
jgi:hypothetical protein